MALITVYPNGVKAGVPPLPSDHERSKRKECQGWTAKSARSNLDFLKSVKIDELDGLGHAFTLTVRECPESPEAWATMRDKYIKRLRRGGLVRLHWVTEWQRRGVPHLHGVAFFEAPDNHYEYALQDRLVRQAWIDVVDDAAVTSNGQDVKPMEATLGWLQYLAKHAARGADHYQRSKDSMPLSWVGVTGRMWGKSGKWPVQEGMELKSPIEAFWRFRRMLRGWRRADARLPVAGFSDALESIRRRRIRSSRRMLKCNLQSLSEVRGVSEWIPFAVQMAMVDLLAGEYEIISE